MRERTLKEKLTEAADRWEPLAVGTVCREALAEIERLEKQCQGLADAALGNGRQLLIFEMALERIKEHADKILNPPVVK